MKFLLDEDLLHSTNADTKKYLKGDIVLQEGGSSQYFHYLKEGELLVSNLSEKGKELLQHQVKSGNFFAEPAVLLNAPFPGNVEVSSSKAVIVKIPRESLINYLMAHPEKLFLFTISVAQKSIKKSLLLKQNVLFNPEDRILLQLKDYKREHSIAGERVLVKLTRKEIALMTGLRIETVIRTIKKMEKDEKLEIVKGKIIF